jgi:hypothetical protein
MTRARKSARRAAKRREGAAMLIVMLLLLIVTATATFAIHSTSTEIRSAGYGRQRMQTRYVAEAGLVSTMIMLEQAGPEPLAIAMEQSATGTTARQLAPEEPTIAANVGNHRVSLGDFTAAPGVGAQPIETTVGYESLGRGMGYAPTFDVDVNDTYEFTGITAGARADGLGDLSYLAATYTARGRTLPATDAYSPATASSPATLRRGYHEAVVNARAFGISGPMRRR